MIELRVLGATELVRAGVRVQSILAQPKRIALLTYLALAHRGGLVRRDELLAVFWPETDDSHGRNSLRQVLHKLRTSLGAEAVVVRGTEEVGLAEEHVRVDALELYRAAAAGDADAVLNLQGGTLLEGLHVPSAPPFTEWLDTERRLLCTAAWEVLYARAIELESVGALQRALAMARAASDLRPLDDASARCLMRVLAGTGHAAAALERYARLERELEVELQATVAPETAELATRVREQSLPAVSGGSEAREPPPGSERGPDAGVGAGRGRVVAALRPSRAVRLATGLVAVLAVVLAAVRWIAPRTGAALPPGVEVVLADAPGADHDDQLYALSVWLRLELQDSEAVSVVPRARVRSALRRMDRDPTESVTLPIAIELARRNGHEAVVSPAFSHLGEEWVLAAEVHLPGRPEPLLVRRERASGIDELEGAVDRLAQEIRAGLGEADGTIQEALPLPEVTTGSFDALQAYALGDRVLQRSIWSETVRYFERAVELDSAFASAWARLGEARIVNGGDAAAAFRRAYELRARLPAAERPELEFLYHFFAERNARAAGVVSAALAETYPGRRAVWLEQQMLLATAALDWDAGARRARALLEAGTDLDAPAWWLVVALRLSAGDEEGALEALDRWEREDGATSDVTGARFRVAWAREDWAETDRLMGMDQGRRQADTWYDYHRSHLALVRGRTEASDRAFDEWLAVPGATAFSGWARFMAWRALVDLHVLGDTARARTRLEAARAAEDPLPATVRPTFATAYAELGDPSTARRILDEFNLELAEFDVRRVRREYGSARSAILLAEGRTEEAIRAARAAVEEDSGGRADCEECPALALARALDRADRRAEAIRWYEDVRDARWILSPFRQMDAAYLIPVRDRLAVLYAAAGRSAEARRENAEIIRAWSGGDSIALRWVRAAEARLRLLAEGQRP